MRALLEEISQAHFPRPPALPEQLDAFERVMGWRLDADLRAFYLHCDGAHLFTATDAPYRLLPLAHIVRVRRAIFGPGRDSDEYGPASWYAVCDVGDTDFVAIDTHLPQNGKYALFDCFHETFPDPAYSTRIAGSFSQFLAQALRSEGRLFWLSGPRP